MYCISIRGTDCTERELSSVGGEEKCTNVRSICVRQAQGPAMKSPPIKHRTIIDDELRTHIKLHIGSYLDRILRMAKETIKRVLGRALLDM